mmetsp:Transcript_8395/g.20936  ORF Transcript_8395/g.20936 Transcript_8395/m.20936 type:complete len:203 (-) Transcript_8395:777-1385(-)
MTFWQPSAIWARQMSDAWRLRQSPSDSHAGSRAPAAGTIALPPREMAMRSRHSCAKPYRSPAPSSSCSSVSAWCHSGSSSTSSRNSISVSNRLDAKVGSLRTMPGALSRASHSVTRNSAASDRVAASSCSARATLIIAPTTSTRERRRKRGCDSATSMNISMASCALASSPAFKVAARHCSMAGSMGANFSRSPASSSAWMK